MGKEVPTPGQSGPKADGQGPPGDPGILFCQLGEPDVGRTDGGRPNSSTEDNVPSAHTQLMPESGEAPRDTHGF